ncbi:MAG: hypothetical protein Q8903_02985 [Bacteroidota bacterium]|nr:hypothetical protein [Bacteroidota bacterium]
MKRIKINNVGILLVLLVIFSKNISSQHFKIEDVKKISIQKLLEADKNKYIPYTDYKFDSIETVYYDNYLWFPYFTKSDNKSAIYAYNDKSKVLYKIKDVDGNDYYPHTRFLISILDGELYYYTRKGLEDGIGYITVNIIDRKELRVKKQIKLKHGFFNKEYISGDTLYVEVQPMKKKLNWEYYILSWLPRGRPDKWEFIEDGNRIRYAFDKDFNIIKEEEIKGAEVSK